MRLFQARQIPILVAVLALAAPLGACSSNGAGADGTASGVPVSSMTASAAGCEQAALADTAEGAIAPDEKVQSLEGFGCANGWAYAFVNVGPADGSESGDGGYTMTMVFQAEGPFWVPKDPMDVCGSATPGSSEPVAPGDSQVPAAIWQDACWTN